MDIGLLVGSVDLGTLLVDGGQERGQELKLEALWKSTHGERVVNNKGPWDRQWSEVTYWRGCSRAQSCR